MQAIASAAFLMPGALGVQEAGFLGLGMLLGLDGEAAAALAVARRFRDLLVFLPGLLFWVRAERRIALASAARRRHRALRSPSPPGTAPTAWFSRERARPAVTSACACVLAASNWSCRMR